MKAGDTASGYFDLANSSFPEQGYDGPPVGGPGATPPWGDYILFSVSAVYVNTPAIPPAPIPEPAGWAMMVLGVAGLRRRRGGARRRQGSPP